MTVNWQELIRNHYATASRISALRNGLLQQLEDGLGGDRKTTLLATSFCSDDIVTSKDISRDVWGPFTLGGLGGLPFGGRTAMAAYAHHIPDNGTALIVYGPHIGITWQGVLGRMRRPGQSHDTSSCGALMAALEHMSSGGQEMPYVPLARDDDQQQAYLEQSLMPFKSRILAAPSPEKEITEVAYALVHQQVHRLIEATRDQFHGRRIMFVGGVIINTDADQEDWAEIRDSGVIDLQQQR